VWLKPDKQNYDCTKNCYWKKTRSGQLIKQGINIRIILKMGLRGVRMQRSEVIEDCGILRGWG
jgi:hypothetical protein